MGAPVFRLGGNAWTSGSTTLLGFTPRASTAWKCTVVSAFREPLVDPESSGSPHFGVFTLTVDGSNAFEARIQHCVHEASVLVLPMNDIHFSGTQTVVWSGSVTNQGVGTASWIGEED